MNPAVLSDLDHNRRRLDYYRQLKTQHATAPSASSSKKASSAPNPVDKWIEIYAERVRKLERQISKQGLRTEIVAAPQKASGKKRA